MHMRDMRVMRIRVHAHAHTRTHNSLSISFLMVHSLQRLRRSGFGVTAPLHPYLSDRDLAQQHRYTLLRPLGAPVRRFSPSPLSPPSRVLRGLLLALLAASPEARQTQRGGGRQASNPKQPAAPIP